MDDGSQWLVHEGDLYVRDGASLPDVCISGSLLWEPGERKSVSLHCSLLWVLPAVLTFALVLLAKSPSQWLAVLVGGHLISHVGKKIRVTVFESSRSVRKYRFRHWIHTGISAGLALFFIGFVRHWEALSGNSMLMVALCFLWMCFPSHRFRAAPFKQGWYELRGISKKAIARMEEIQRHGEIRQDGIRERRKKR